VIDVHTYMPSEAPPPWCLVKLVGKYRQKCKNLHAVIIWGGGVEFAVWVVVGCVHKTKQVLPLLGDSIFTPRPKVLC